MHFLASLVVAASRRKARKHQEMRFTKAANRYNRDVGKALVHLVGYGLLAARLPFQQLPSFNVSHFEYEERPWLRGLMQHCRSHGPAFYLGGRILSGN
jgi:hypothetical protein